MIKLSCVRCGPNKKFGTFLRIPSIQIQSFWARFTARREQNTSELFNNLHQLLNAFGIEATYGIAIAHNLPSVLGVMR